VGLNDTLGRLRKEVEKLKISKSQFGGNFVAQNLKIVALEEQVREFHAKEADRQKKKKLKKDAKKRKNMEPENLDDIDDEDNTASGAKGKKGKKKKQRVEDNSEEEFEAEDQEEDELIVEETNDEKAKAGRVCCFYKDFFKGVLHEEAFEKIKDHINCKAYCKYTDRFILQGSRRFLGEIIISPASYKDGVDVGSLQTCDNCYKTKNKIIKARTTSI